MIDVVLFDVDGTLLNTIDYIVGAYAHTAREHGLAEVTRDTVVGMGGQGLEECYQLLAPGCDPLPFCNTHRSFQLANTALATAYPGAIAVLEAVHAQGRRIGAVTSRRTTALRTLELTGLLPHLDTVVTGDDVANCKPDPEGVLKALVQLGGSADSAIMVGDTSSDIIAAQRAAVRTVGVTYGFYSPADFAAFPPDRTIHDLMQLPGLLDRWDNV